MFESVISEVVTRFLGKYVEGFNKDNIKIGMLKGDVKLKNLQLKKDSLDRFAIPISIRYGHIGSVIIKVPWKNLKSKPLIVNIDDIFMILCPRKNIGYDEKAEEAKRIENRKTALVEYEEHHLLSKKMENDKKKKGSEDEDPTKKDKVGFKEKLIQRILNNIQVNINRIHIRYEDSLSQKNVTSSFGIVLEKLQAESTDKDWNPHIKKKMKDSDTGLVDRVVYKKVSMENLFLYMNTDTMLCLSDYKDEDISGKLNDMITTRRGLNYVLHPVTNELHLTINNSPEPAYQLPRLTVQSILNNLELTFSEPQLLSTMKIVNYFTHFQFLKARSKYRPTKTVKEDPLAWFRYSVYTVMEEQKKVSWNHIFAKIKLRRRYVELFKKTQGISWYKPLTSEERAELTEIEFSRDIEDKDVMLFRALARKEISEESSKFSTKSEFKKMMKQVKRSRRKELEEKKKKLKIKTKKLKKSISKKKIKSKKGEAVEDEESDEVEDDVLGEELEEAHPFELTEEERKELYATVGFDEDLPEQKKAPKEYVEFKVDFNIQQAKFTFEKEAKAGIVEFELSQLSTGVDIRPEGGKKLDISLQSIVCRDLGTKKTKYPLLISQRKEFEDKDVFHVAFEMNPLGRNVDISLDAELYPLDIIYSHELTKNLIGLFLSMRSGADAKMLEMVLISQFRKFKDMTQDQIVHALETTKKYAVKMALRAPKLHIPQDNTSGESAMLVLDLGMVDVLNKPSKWLAQLQKEGGDSKRPLTLHGMNEKNFYDSFELYFSKVQLLIGKSLQCKTQLEHDIELLEPFNARISFYNCLIPNNLEIPRFMLEGSIDTIDAHVSSLKLRYIVDIADTMLELVDVLKQDKGKSEVSAPNEGYPHGLDRGKGTTIATAVSSLVGDEMAEYDFYEEDEDFDDTDSVISSEPSTPSSVSEVQENWSEEELKLLVQRRLVCLDFRLGGANVTISTSRNLNDDSLKNNRKIVTIHVNQLSLTGVKRMYDFSANVKLGMFTVEDHLLHAIMARRQPDQASEKKLMAVGGGENLEFLEFTTKMMSTESPEYRGEKISIAAKISTMYFHFNQATVAEVLSLLIVCGWEDLIPPQSEDDAALSLQQAMNSDRLAREKRLEMKRLGDLLPAVNIEDESEVAIAFGITVESFVFFIHDDITGDGIAKGYVKKVNVRAKKLRTAIVVDGKVLDLRVFDEVDKGSLYSEVLAPQYSDKSLLEFSVRHNSTLRTFKDPFAPSNAVSVRWRPLRAALPPQLFLSLLENAASGALKDTLFTLALKTKTAIKNRSFTARKRLQSKLGMAVQNLTASKDLLMLDVRAEAGLIIFPRNSHSDEVVAVRLGTLMISTSHTGKNKRKETIKILLENTSISKGRYVPSAEEPIENPSPLFYGIKIVSEVKKPIDLDLSVPQLAADVNLGSIHVSLLDSHLEFIYDAIDYSLKDLDVGSLKRLKPENLAKLYDKVGKSRRASSFKESAVSLVDRLIEPSDGKPIGMDLVALQEAKKPSSGRSDSEAWTTFIKTELNVSLETAVVELVKTRNPGEENAEHRPLLTTVIKDVASLAKMHSDKSLTFNLLCGSVYMDYSGEKGKETDIQPIFRRILTTKAHTNFFHFHVSKSAELRYINLSVVEPELILVPEAIMEVVNFVTPERIPLLKEKTKKMLAPANADIDILVKKPVEEEVLHELEAAEAEDESEESDLLTDTSSVYSEFSMYDEAPITEQLREDIIEDIRKTERRKKNAKAKMGQLARNLNDRIVGGYLLEISCDIVNPRVIIPEDPCDCETRAIAFQMRFEGRIALTSTRIDAQASLKNVALTEILAKEMTGEVGADLGAPGGAKPVLGTLINKDGLANGRQIIRNPINIIGSLKKNRLKDFEPLLIQCDVSGVALFLSYNGFKFWFERILSLKERIMALQILSLKGEVKDFLAARKKMKKKVEGRAATRDLRTRKHMKKTIAKQTVVFQEKAEPTTPAIFKNAGKINFSGFFITIFNDCAGRQIPVMDFSVTRTRIEFRNIPQDMKLVADFRIKIDYFNHTMISWEPLLEHFTTSVLVMSTSPTENHPTIEEEEDEYATNFAVPKFVVRVETKDDFEVVASYPCLRETLNTFQTWIDDIGRPKNMVPDEFHPFSIENKTGIDILWSSRGIEDDSVKVLPPDTKKPIDLGGGLYTRSEPDSERTVSVSFIKWKKWSSMLYTESNPTVQSIQFDKVGFRRGLLLMPPELVSEEERAKKNDKIMEKTSYEVVSQAGARTLIIGSSLLITNITGQDIALRVVIGGETKDIGMVNSGEQYYVPVNLAFRGVLLARPGVCDWVALLDNGSWSGKETRSDIIFPFPKAESPDVRVCCSLNRREGFDGIWEIKLQNIVQIFNALPVELNYRIRMEKRPKPVVLAEGVIKPFSTEKISTVDVSLKSFIELKIEYHGWSKAVALRQFLGVSGDKFLQHAATMPRASDNRKALTLNMNGEIEESYSRKITVYAPYWLLNQSANQVVFSESSSKEKDFRIPVGDPHGIQLSSEVKSALTDIGSKRRRIKVFDKDFKKELSAWSDPFYASTIGMNGTIVVPSLGKNSSREKAYIFGIRIRAADECSMTKIVTIEDRYVIHNKCAEQISIKQAGDTRHDPISLKEGSSIPFALPNASLSKFVTFKVGKCEWTGATGLDILGDVTLPLRRLVNIDEKSTFRNPEGFLGVNVYMEGSQFIIDVSMQSKKLVPYNIFNKTNYDLVFNQAGVRGLVPYFVPSRKRELFAWDEPNGDHSINVTFPGGSIFKQYKLDKLKVFAPFVFTDKEGEEVKIYAAVRAKGPRKTFLISDTKIHNVIENEDQEETIYVRLEVKVPNAALSLMDHVPKDILYATATDVALTLSYSNLFLNVEAEVQNIQVDNQNFDALFPVCLYPSPDNPSDRPFLHFSLTKSNALKDVFFLKYASFLVQSFHVEIDETYADQFLTVFNKARPLVKESRNQIREADLRKRLNLLNEEDGEEKVKKEIASKKVKVKRKKRVYFQFLQLHPIKVNISYASSHRHKESKVTTPLDNLLAMVGATIVNLDKVPMRFNALVLEHAFILPKTFLGRVSKHYVQQFIVEMYKILGSSEVLGNPVGFWNNVSTGVFDFFYEPAQGLVKSPQDFGIGVATGTMKLVRGTTYGAFASVSDVTSALGKGAAVLTLDNDYIHSREVESRRNAPKNVFHGMYLGTGSAMRGIFGGATGVLTQPIKGAKKDGITGLSSGTVKGVTGLVFKPVAGGIDGISKSAAGIKNMARPFDVPKRKRYARTISIDGIISPYDRDVAEGQFILFSLHNETYTKETYRFHCRIIGKGIILLTHFRLLFLDENGGEKWNVHFDDILEVKSEENKIVVAAKVRKQYMLGWGTYDEFTQYYSIDIPNDPNKEKLVLVQTKILSVVASYSESKHERRVVSFRYDQ